MLKEREDTLRIQNDCGRQMKLFPLEIMNSERNKAKHDFGVDKVGMAQDYPFCLSDIGYLCRLEESPNVTSPVTDT